MTKSKKPAKPYTVRFTRKPITPRERKVFDFLFSNGESTILQIADGVFSKKYVKPQRCSWVRNQLRNLRAWNVVRHVARKGTEPAKYGPAASSLPEEALTGGEA